MILGQVETAVTFAKGDIMGSQRARNLVRRIDHDIEQLFPGYFALVMATGAVSLAGQLRGLARLAWALFLANLAAYAVLSALLLIRLLRYPGKVFDDICDPARGAGFFTIAAGTCVLGSQVVAFTHGLEAARWLWALGVTFWLVVMYSFFAATVARKEKPSLQAGINGAWLIASVATQAVSILGTQLAPSMGANRELVLFFALCMYLLGAMLYLAIITLIFYRLTFVELPTARITPLYWVNMGTVAIAALAGSTLLSHSENFPLLLALRPFVMGLAVLSWATATWWIPLLLILGVVRHGIRHFPLRYNPQYWGMVFPLGMYTLATYHLGQATQLGFLKLIADYFFFLPLAGWLGTSAGLLWQALSAMRHVEAHALEAGGE